MKSGEIHARTAERYNPIVVALASEHGGIIGLARKLGIPYPRLVNWAKGDHVPDFSRPIIAKRHRATERRLVALSGKMLVEVFGTAQQIEETLLPLRALSASTYQPEDLYNLKIDLERAISQLRDDKREILRMFAGGMTHDEIASKFNCKRQYIGQQLDDIRRQIKRRCGIGKKRLAPSY